MKRLSLILKCGAGFVIIFLIISSATPMAATNSNNMNEKASDIHPRSPFISSYDTHDAIVITSNADFASQGFAGSGTSGDPYIIEDYEISSGDECISISDTDAYFIIRDCMVDGGRTNTYPRGGSGGDGIVLERVSNGEIRGNTITGCMYGIYFSYDADNNTIADNTISNCIWSGIYLFYGENNIITGNTFSNLDNYGIEGFEGSNNLFSSNTFEDGAFYFSGDGVENWKHTITTDNTVSGKQIRYFWNMNGGTIDATPYGQIILANCTNVVVENGEFSETSVGIVVGFSSTCLLTKNSFSENVHGVSLYDSPHITVIDNIFTDNYMGVYFTGSTDTTVFNNSISGSGYGVFPNFADDSLIGANLIIGGGLGVYCLGAENITLSSNTMTNAGFSISGYDPEHWYHTVDSDNLVNGKQIGYFWGMTSGVIDGTPYGQIILANCTGVTVKDGVYCNVSHEISLGHSSNCILTNNTCCGATTGAMLNSYTSNNTFYLNVFYKNGINAYDFGTGNHWNTTGQGNYWDDYSGTGVYPIAGGSGAVDYHPFKYSTGTTNDTSEPDIVLIAVAVVGVAVVVVVVIVLVKFRKGSAV